MMICKDCEDGPEALEDECQLCGDSVSAVAADLEAEDLAKVNAYIRLTGILFSDAVKRVVAERVGDEYALIPETTRYALDAWKERAQWPGRFLRAVLCNDLQEAFGRADSKNTEAMHAIVKYVYNRMPMGCHGGRVKMNAWSDAHQVEVSRG